ncbi:MAG: ABC transporter permease [Candidatus Hodarchaeales archaeon]
MSSTWIIAKKELSLLFKSKRRILLFFSIPLTLLVLAIIIGGIGAIFAFTTTQDGPPTLILIDHVKDNNTAYIINRIETLNVKILDKSNITDVFSILDQNSPPDLLVYFPANFSQLLTEKNSTAKFFVFYNDQELRFEAFSTIIADFGFELNSIIVQNDYGDLNLNRISGVKQGTSKGFSAVEASSLIIIPLYILFAFTVPPLSLILISVTQEREQKTLESLLLQPISRKAIISGKLLYGVFLVLANISMSLGMVGIIIGLFLIVIPKDIQQELINSIAPTIDTSVILFVAYIIIGLILVSLLMIGLAVLISLIAKDEREGNMVISIFMIAPIGAIILIFVVPITSLSIIWQLIFTSLPIIGFLFSIYIILILGVIPLPAYWSLIFQGIWCVLTVWMASSLIETEGILEINVSVAIKRLFKRI